MFTIPRKMGDDIMLFPHDVYILENAWEKRMRTRGTPMTLATPERKDDVPEIFGNGKSLVAV